MILNGASDLQSDICFLSYITLNVFQFYVYHLKQIHLFFLSFVFFFPWFDGFDCYSVLCFFLLSWVKFGKLLWLLFLFVGYVLFISTSATMCFRTYCRVPSEVLRFHRPDFLLLLFVPPWNVVMTLPIVNFAPLPSATFPLWSRPHSVDWFGAVLLGLCVPAVWLRGGVIRYESLLCNSRLNKMSFSCCAVSLSVDMYA